MRLTEDKLTLIELSNRCNLRCPTCAGVASDRPKGTMKLGEFHDILNQIEAYFGPKSKAFRIALHGYGEPTQNPNLDVYLDTLDAWGARCVDFTTNGTAPLDLTAHRCLAWVRVSLNSCRKATHEKINQGSDFAQVVANIKALATSRPPFRVVVQHMVCRATRGEREAEFRQLLGPGKWQYRRKKQHDYCGQVDVPHRGRGCSTRGYGSDLCIHWDGTLVGCCSDATTCQSYGNAFTDGIYSPKTLEARERAHRAYKRHNYSTLPLCRQCHG